MPSFYIPESLFCHVPAVYPKKLYKSTSSTAYATVWLKIKKSRLKSLQKNNLNRASKPYTYSIKTSGDGRPYGKNPGSREAPS